MIEQKNVAFYLSILDTIDQSSAVVTDAMVDGVKLD